LLKIPTTHLKSGKTFLESLEKKSSGLKPVYVRSGKKQGLLDKAMSNDKAQMSNEIQMLKLKKFLDFGL
jgi:hypothetical protein